MSSPAPSESFRPRSPVGDLPPLRIGMVGAGFLAATRARCYAKLPGGGARISAVVAARRERAEEYAERHGIPAVCADLDELLARDDVDVVDLCVPNLLHRPFAERAAAAGKHVICTKPLAAYVGQDLGESPSSAEVSARPRSAMYEVAVEDARRMVEACESAGKRLLYGENWLYAPAIQRAAELLAASGGTILEMRGWEAHCGSHSPFSKQWLYTGGGALLRLGAHPVGAMLHLKAREGIAKNGQPVGLRSITAEVGEPTRQHESEHLARGWEDVETWGSALLTFDDGTHAIARGSDLLLGGMESRLEIHATNAHYVCNLSPNDMLQTYAPDAGIFEGQYMMEKASTGAGWNTPMPDEDWTSGQLGMCAAFVDALRQDTPTPSDGRLGLAVTRAIYAAYRSAEEGCRIQLD